MKFNISAIQKPNINHNLKTILIFGIAINIFCICYVLFSKNFYYWSTAESWNIAIKIAQGAYHPNLFKEIYKSILTQEVNYLSALPSSLFVLVFGQSRLTYILSLANFYAIPIFVCIYATANKLGKAPIVTSIMIFVAMPAIMYMVLMGFAEIGGVMVGLLCMYLYLCTETNSILKYIFLGFMLTITAIWSHAFIFFVAAFVSAMMIECIITKKSIIRPFITFAVIVCMLSLFFREYISARIISLYGYTNDNINVLSNIKYLLRYIGLILIGVVSVQSFRINKDETKGKILFLWSTIVICFVALITTRTHGQLHILPYIPSFVTLCIILIKQIDDIRTFCIASALAICNIISVFIPRVQPTSVDEIKKYSLFPTFSMTSKSRSDYDALLTLKGTLDSIINDGEYLGVLSYSDKLNPDLLNNTQISDNHSSSRRNYIAFTIPYFDSNIPDISPLCNANYMLVATPAQTIAENQKILTCAVDSFENYSDIAKSYVLLQDYTQTIDGIEVKLFKRMRSPSEYEKKEFLRKLNN